MYPVRLGFDVATARIELLLRHGHTAEALLTTVFTAEKTIRRSLKGLIVLRGLKNKHADIILGRRGFDELKKLWPVFDPLGRGLPEIAGQEDWAAIKKAVTMRNKLVHGERTYGLDECRLRATEALAGVKGLRAGLKASTGYAGWKSLPVRRKSRLPWLGDARLGPEYSRSRGA